MGTMAVSDELALEIGRISVAFADVEAWVGFFIWSLIGPDQHVGQIVTSEMSFSRQLDMLVSLFRHRCDDSAKIERLRQLVARLSETEQQRNTFLHSLWTHQSPDPSEALRLKITAKRKKGLSHAKETVSVSQLHKVAESFQLILGEFSTFMIEFLATK